MSKNVYLHIGLWKTGTTAIQNTLYANRVHLAEYGVCYPSISVNHTFLASAFHPHPDDFIVAKSRGCFGEELIAWHKKSLADFELEIKGFSDVVISSEFLLDLPKNSIKKLVDYLYGFFDKVQFIVYIRHPVDHFSSAVNEQVKQGHYPLKKAFDIHSKGNEFIKINNWVEVLGRENAIVRPFDNENFHKGDIVSDFIYYTLSKDFSSINKLKDKSNKSLSHAAILIANKLAVRFPSFSKVRSDSSYLFDIKGVSYKAPKDIQSEVLERSKKFISSIKNDFNIEFSSSAGQIITNTDQEVWSEETIDSLAVLLNKMSLRIENLSSENACFKAMEFAKEGDFDQARLMFDRSIARGGSIFAFREYAIFLKNNCLYDDALIYCNKAIDLAPDREWLQVLKKKILIGKSGD